MFSYAPLDRDKAEIRLIRFMDSPATNETTAPISLELRNAFLKFRHEALADMLPFDAISYTWGDSAESRAAEVLIENASLPISSNLHAGLTQLRENGIKSWLWVDSICIEQSNYEEKAWQVNQMRALFSQARRVHVWLGPSAEGTDLAMDFVNRMGPRALDVDASHLWRPWRQEDWMMDSFISRYMYVHGRSGSSRPEGPALLQVLLAVFTEPGLQHCGYEEEPELQRGINTIISNDYWSRIWVIQEVSLAKEALVMCGTKTMNLDALDALLRAIEACPGSYRSNDSVYHFGYASFLQRLVVFRCLPLDTRRQLRRGMGVKAEDILYQFSPSQRPYYLASDPRDIVFGILGLIEDNQMVGLTADYSMTTAQVFEAITRYLVADSLGKFPARFSLDGWMPKETGRMSSLPSWVPDWREIGRFGRGIPGVHGEFDTDATSRKVTAQHRVRESTMPGILHLSGCPVDVVQESMKLPEESIDTQALSSFIVRFAHSSTESGPGENFIWRTIRHRKFSDSWEGRGGDPSVVSLLRAVCRGDDFSSIQPLDAKQENFLSYWMAYCANIPFKSVEDALTRIRASHLRQQEQILEGRTLFKTRKAMFGLGPKAVRAGDVVALLWGIKVPIILRPRGDDATGSYVYVGSAYVDGIMDGEFMATCPTEQEFAIH